MWIISYAFATLWDIFLSILKADMFVFTLISEWQIYHTTAKSGNREMTQISSDLMLVNMLTEVCADLRAVKQEPEAVGKKCGWETRSECAYSCAFWYGHELCVWQRQKRGRCEHKPKHAASSLIDIKSLLFITFCHCHWTIASLLLFV